MNQLTITLEQLIDRHGLAAVLSGLAEVCGEKANHIRTNWQDRLTAKPWDALSAKLDTVHAKAMDLGLYNR